MLHGAKRLPRKSIRRRPGWTGLYLPGGLQLAAGVELSEGTER